MQCASLDFGMSINTDFKTPGRLTILNKSLVGNYDESLSDAKGAHHLHPTFIRAIERGKFLTEEVFLRSLFGEFFKDPGHQLSLSCLPTR